MANTNGPGVAGKRTSRWEQERVLKELELSGLSVVEFAQSRKLRPQTLYRWIFERRKRMASPGDAESKPQPSQFVELDLAQNEARASAPLIVHLDSRLRAEIRDPEHLKWVASLRQHLEDQAC